MEVFKIDLRIGYGSPVGEDITFNFHFNRPEGLEWVVTFSYAQLCRLDNFVCVNCDKIKHVVFPLLSRHRIKATIKALRADDFSLESVRYLNRLKGMIEIWAHQILMRLHATPRHVHTNVQNFFFLPNGPGLGDPVLPGVLEHTLSRKKHGLSVFGFGRKKDEALDNDDEYDLVVQQETEAEESQPPLLRVSVRRGREGRRGKLEYEVQIYFSRNSHDEPWVVYRRYSEFAALFQAMKGFESENFLFTTFPLPPAKCSIGMSLDEAELSIRTRQLDAWFRDAFCHYMNMTSQSRAAMRVFLQLIAISAEEGDFNETLVVPSSGSTVGISDPSQRSLIALSIQNRLSVGMVEGSRAVMYEFVASSPANSRSPAQAKKGTSRAGSIGGGTSTSRDRESHHRDRDGSDDDTVVSGDSKHSSSQVSTMSLATKKKKRNLLNTMWEKMSSGSSKTGRSSLGGPDALDSATSNASDKKRTSKYVVLNASVSGENPFMKSAMLGLGGSGAVSSATSALVAVAEGEGEEQSMSMATGPNGTFSVADMTNLLLPHQYRSEGVARPVPIIRHSDFNKELFQFVAEDN